FLNLGVYSAARDAYLVLSVTAQEQYIRWLATLNLLDIASLTGSETMFEDYRRELSTAELPPRLAAAFELNVGEAYQRFGNSDRALTHLKLALKLAEEHSLNQILFLAEEAIAKLQVAS